MAYLEQTQLTDEKDVIVNPASEESTILLRRITKLLESLATVDTAQRQRVVVDTGISIAAGQTLGTVSTVTGVTTVSTVSAVTSVGTITNLTQLAGWNQQIFSDPARTAYNNGIRSQLTFS
jgi:hypothetical protein